MQKIFNSLELRATYVVGLKVKNLHTAEQLDTRSGRTTRSIFVAVTELIHGNNVDLYVELGASSAHNLSFIKRLIEASNCRVVSTKLNAFASITIQLLDGVRYTLNLIPHTKFNINRYISQPKSIIIDHDISFEYDVPGADHDFDS